MRRALWPAGLLLIVVCSLPFVLDAGGPGTGGGRPTLAFTTVERAPLRGREPSQVKAGLRWLPSAPDVRRLKPRPGRWQPYVLLPAERSVCPERVALARTSSIALPGALTCSEQGTGAVTSAAAANAKLILDFGREMSGHLQVNVANGSGPGTLELAYSESLAYLRGDCDRLGVEAFAPPGTRQPPCPRNVAIAGGAQRYDDPAPRSGFRYVLLTFKPSTARSIALASVGVPDYGAMPQARSLAADAAYRGWFLSSDDALNHYWYDGAYNAQVNTVAAGQAGVYYEGIAGLPASQPVMVDGAKRDRYIWYDLAGPKTLIPLLYGDAETPKDSLLALGALQTAKGFIPACRIPRSFYGAPCATQWTDATAWWLIALGEYWLWTGDDRFAAGAYPAVSEALAALASCAGKHSALIEPCNGAATYDSAGVSTALTTYLNAVYYKALLTGGKLAILAHHPADGVRYRRRAARLAGAINARLWDAIAGAYRHSDRRPRLHPQDANVLAALWGIAPAPRARAGLRYVKDKLWTRYGVRNGNPGSNFHVRVADLVANWISYFELQARVERDAIADVRAMLDASWRYMHLDWKSIPGPQGNTEEPPSSTGWEHVTADGQIFRGAQSSLAHVWSEGATVAATTGLLGLTPTSPGFSAWQLKPHASGSGLAWAQGSVPTPRGPFRTMWRISGDLHRPSGFRLDLSAPPGTSGAVFVPLYGTPHRVRIDGKPALRATPAGDYLRIANVTGSHSLTWVGGRPAAAGSGRP
jgi:hypothetical protein